MSNETKLMIGLGVVTIVVVVAATFLIGGSPSSQQDAAPITNPEALIRSDSHKISAKGAKVTVVEFGDFQCPACGASHPIVTQILTDYKGKINFVFRNFPLTMHKNAQIAAEAAEAAGEQGKFFQMHDELFNNQKEWETSSKPLDIFVTYAKDLKLDVDKFKKAVESKKYENKIKKDQADGLAVGVNSTPTFYINAIKQEGGLPYNEFKAKIDKQLAK